VGAIPRDAGAAWVLVQHLSADHETTLHELLAVETDLPVRLLCDGDAVEPDRIGVAPPGYAVDIVDEQFRLVRLHESGVRTPIDQCFSAVAEQRASDGFCIVLSGTGSDGTEGLKRIKAEGGIALAQAASGARFPGMPDSARATGLVDFTLEPRSMPGRICDILSFRDQMVDDQSLDRLRERIETNLPQVVETLAIDDDAHDFSGYKPGTLVRRIDRRMMLTHHRTIEGYVSTLASDFDERARLSEDFLIGVTRFFRDPEAFETLKREWIAPTLSQQEDGGDVRVWVPGCSTGEEVYTVAILVLESLRELGLRRRVQLFGTDIDQAAVYNARQGAYATSALADMDPALRERYFVSGRSGMRASTLLRESCVFALHNVLSDPPFSRVDLISCRNLLIYFTNAAQREVMSRFHYALNEGGALFLGSSESANDERHLFDAVNPRHRLFSRNDRERSDYSSLSESVRTPSGKSATRRSAAADRLDEAPIERRSERAYLDRMAPAFATIDAQDRVAYLSPGMTRHVRPLAGAPSLEYGLLLTSELHLPCKRAIGNARRTGKRATVDVQLLNRADAASEEEQRAPGEAFRLLAEPMPAEKGPSATILVSLQPLEPSAVASGPADTEESGAAELREQLLRTQRDLEIALNEFDSSNQELKSTNEELLSMNLEMQSTNEELETSREELQSINEELQTMNAELNANNSQLRRANDDLKNLFEAGELATLFLDRRLCVRSYTPQLTRLFGIHERDAGRPLIDVTRRFEHDQLEADALHVYESLEVIEREIGIAASGETFIMRIRPYRTIDDRLDGVVLSFFDITARKRQEVQLAENRQDLARQYAELETLYDTTPVGLALIGRNRRWLRINAELAAINGFPPEAHIGKRQEELIPDIDNEVAAVQQRVFDTGEPVLGLEVRGYTPAEPEIQRDWIADYYPVMSDGEVFAVGACVREVTAQKAMERDLLHNEQRARLLLAELQHRVKNTLATIIAIVRFMSRTVASVDDMRDQLSDRLHALSRTHDLLTETTWDATSISQLLEGELAPVLAQDRDPVELIGPAVALPPRAALAVGMAIHELATNSLKHGALADDQGRIVVRTERQDNRVRFEWTELGTRPVDRQGDAKVPRGFGRYLLEQALPEQLEGKSSLRFTDDGMEFSIEFEAEPIELRGSLSLMPVDRQ